MSVTFSFIGVKMRKNILYVHEKISLFQKDFLRGVLRKTNGGNETILLPQSS